MGAGSFALLSTAAFTVFFAAMDLLDSDKRGHAFKPNELNVTLTKADGPLRVDTMLIEPTTSKTSSGSGFIGTERWQPVLAVEFGDFSGNKNTSRQALLMKRRKSA